ncbi:sugar porter family MFS transporter [Hydrotalea sandarakina]|jgi:sugar porter (SP) family MFS transporter|uniref:Sugar porter (SP) family MFS transporter n=1 Tax=Hydrotalea sandarakina TaxID=1004304 RepID=A0A2W7TCB3_9BACT|nr:sugar porter family MFS transporter [Hydrotalea sandarakina]PZX60882.1 sugar porter (SP) family MFS transporter [Hydrotalea sandarakina]
MNKKLVLWSITVGLGGLLFGMDVAVISGAEQAIQQLWQLSNWMHGTAIAMALYGTAFGAAFGNIPANKIGRKKTLFWIGVLFLITSIGAAVSTNVYAFMLFRFISGLSIGASSVVAPVYISEIAPPKYRGRMVISFQLNVVAGILIAYFSNYLLQGFDGKNDWRWMLGVVAIPSAAFSILMIFTPETPRWLVLYKKDDDAARKVLALTEDNTDHLIERIKQSVSSNTERLFQKKHLRLLILAFLIAFFNQLSGINAIIYFAPKVFEMAGIGRSAALFSTVGIGVVNLIFTIIGWSLIDKFGRRTLMFIGSFGYIISLSLIAIAFNSDNHSLIVYYVFMFIAAHAIGQGAVIWVFLSELFPNAIRASGTSFGCLTHWFFAALVAQVFPFFAATVSGTAIFGFFAFMMVLQLLYVWKMMPETKGIALENMESTLVLH